MQVNEKGERSGQDDRGNHSAVTPYPPVKQGKDAASGLALKDARVAIRRGKKQIYGSQLRRNDKTGKYYVLPLESPEDVDQRRSEMNLSPISEYVKRWGINWSVEQYKKDIAANNPKP